MTDAQTYDDGSEVEWVTDVDEPPKSGVWVDPEEILHGDLTPEELAEGERQGREIDVDDDEDNGLS